MNPETSLQNKIRLALSKAGIINWRNNTGMGWAGKMIRGKGTSVFVGHGDVVVRNARPLRAGLCEGSSDIIGIKPVLITPDMVGQTIGQFVAPEVKTKTGKPTEAQENFLKQVNQAGGLGMIIRSAGEVEDVFLVKRVFIH